MDSAKDIRNRYVVDKIARQIQDVYGDMVRVAYFDNRTEVYHDHISGRQTIVLDNDTQAGIYLAGIMAGLALRDIP